MSRLDALREQFKAELAHGFSRETAIKNELDDLYVAALVECQKHVSVIAGAADDQASRRRHMSDVVTEAKRVADSASSLSDKVRHLDLTLKNLREAKKFFQGLDQLSDVDKRIAAAMSADDSGRAAAEIVSSFHKFEKAGFASALDHSVVKRYRVYEAKLQESIKRDLMEAVADKESEAVHSTTRTLFSIGRESEALELYLDYARAIFTEKCNKHTSVAVSMPQGDRPVHVEAVTSIFLEVADAIQRHQKFVEEEFGVEKFSAFLTQIEYEANSHSVKVIRMLMKATSTAQHQVGPNGSATAAANLDMCLEELVTIVMRCHRFMSYMHSLKGNDDVPLNGSLQQVIEEVAGAYVAGEQALMTSLIRRAMDDDCVAVDDESSFSSSIVDDCFYIYKKALDRSLLTADSDCACAVVNNISNLIQIDLKQFLEDSFESSKKLFANYLPSISSRRQGLHTLEPLFKAKREESGPGVNRIVRSADCLPHALSNIAVTSAYVNRFKADCLESYDRAFATKRTDKRALFQQCVGTFDSISGELSDVQNNSMKYLLQQLRGSFINPFVNAIESVDFDIDDQGFAEMQVNDPFMRAFIASLESLVKWVKCVVAAETTKPFLSLLCDYIALRLERSIVQTASRFSLLGATQLYQDVSRLVSFFAESTDVPVKSKFGRLQEVCSILCLESLAEFRQIYSDGFALQAYKISNKDVRTILSLRAEFSHDAIATTII